MKKITILTLLLLSAIGFSQSDCSNALPISLTSNNTVTAYGTTVATPDCTGYTAQSTGSAWFSYTATANGVLNLSSDLAANNNVDTQVSVYSGSCSSLVCEGFTDDVSYPSNLTSTGSFNVTSGTTYYIAWEDRWSSTVPFDFTASFVPVTGPPNSVTTPTPADMATNVTIDTADNNNDGAADNAVQLTWVPSTTGSPATEYDILYGTDPAALNNLTQATTFTGTSVRITGNNFNTTYYWSIVAINGSGSSTNNPVWSFTTETPSGTPPTNAIGPTPADGAVNVTVDTTDGNNDGNPDNAVDISWMQDPSGQQPTAYTIRLGDSPTTLNDLTTTFTNTAARFLSLTGNTTYYWQVVPTNNGVEALNQPVWSFTTENVASVEDKDANFFTISPNPAQNFLEIESELVINNIEIFNALGQNLMKDVTLNDSTLDISKLNSGFYIIKASSDNGSQSIKFIKK